MKRPKKVRPPASPRPWRAVVVGVDPSEKANGWSVWVGNQLYRSGECRLRISSVSEVITYAMTLAKNLDIPCVLVTERPFIQKAGRSHGASDHSHKLWRDVWIDLGGVQKRVIRVWPAVWRPPVLGKGTGNMARDDVREIEQAAALNFVVNYGYSPAPEGIVIGPDQAPGICIGRWATHAGEVGEALPVKLRVCA